VEVFWVYRGKFRGGSSTPISVVREAKIQAFTLQEIGEHSLFSGEDGKPSEVRTFINQSSIAERRVGPLSERGINEREDRPEAGEVERNRNSGEKTKKGKLIKNKEVCLNFVLGFDIQIDGVMEETEVTLVRRAKVKKYSINYITKWISKAWKEAPNHQFELTTLARGWFMTKFGKGETLEWVLRHNYCFCRERILFKNWNPLFDAQTEKVGEILVWVRLPGLPPQFWTVEVFRAIRNTLCIFLEKDMSFLETRDKRLARILVRLDPREGMVEEIHLKYKELTFTQIMDYEHLPFHCHRCHKYGNLARDCPLGFRRRRRHRRDVETQIALGEKRRKMHNQRNWGRGRKEARSQWKFRESKKCICRKWSCRSKNSLKSRFGKSWGREVQQSMRHHWRVLFSLPFLLFKNPFVFLLNLIARPGPSMPFSLENMHVESVNESLNSIITSISKIHLNQPLLSSPMTSNPYEKSVEKPHYNL